MFILALHMETDSYYYNGKLWSFERILKNAVFCSINHDKLLIQDLVKIKLPYLLLKAWAEFTLYPSSLIIILACQYLTMLCVRINPKLQCRSSVYVLWNTHIQYEYVEWIIKPYICHIYSIYFLLFPTNVFILSFFVNSSCYLYLFL